VTLTQIEAMVVDLALAVAGSILDREVATASDPGRDALVRALALAPDHETYLARVHPADLEAITAVAELAPGRTLELVADPTVGPGGCVVEAGSARIDARIDTALARVREVLQP
jgi:flagellar assembly protein FliH